MSILCDFGFHKKYTSIKYFPNIEAEILTGYKISVYCIRCGKNIHCIHKVWNENTKEFEDAN